MGVGTNSMPVVSFFECPNSFSVMSWIVKVMKLEKDFLAPTGAQGITLSVCLSVCPFGDKLSRAVNPHLFRSESNQRANKQSESTQRALRSLKSESHSLEILLLVLLGS